MGKKKKTHKKKSKKSSKVEETHISFGMSDDEMDLSKELHPVGYFINDREEMISQMFAVTKPERIRAMLPPILKDISMEELKAYCLEELLGMSSKRVLSILDGQELESSSESENESSGSDSSLDNKSSRRSSTELKGVESDDDSDNKIVPLPDLDMLEIGITREEMGELLECMPSNKGNERKRQPTVGDQESIASVKRNKAKTKKSKDNNVPKIVLKNSTEPEETTDVVEKKIDDENNSDIAADADENKGKTLLEILELEMRARAIRALLKQQAGDGEEDEEEVENTIAMALSEVKSSSPVDSLKESENEPQEPAGSSCIASPRKKQKVKESVTSDKTNTNKGIENSVKSRIKSKDEQRVPELESYKERAAESKTSGPGDRDTVKEDGEKNSSGDSVVEVQSDSNAVDVIVLDDSEDESPGGAPKQEEKTQDQACDDSKEVVEEKKKSDLSTSETDLNKSETPEVSWAGRWLQSEGVQKVVTTSKICGKIRKRMKLNRK